MSTSTTPSPPTLRPDPDMTSLKRDFVLACAEYAEAQRDFFFAFLLPDGDPKKAKLAGCCIGMERAIVRTRAALSSLDTSTSATPVPDIFDTRESVEAFMERAGADSNVIRGETVYPITLMEWNEARAMLRRLIHRLDPLHVPDANKTK